jgi:fused signal recognition particle receptor
MRDDMVNILEPSAKPLVVPEQPGPSVILMVGINGVGKTTTIGKLAKQFQQRGKKSHAGSG